MRKIHAALGKGRAVWRCYSIRLTAHLLCLHLPSLRLIGKLLYTVYKNVTMP